MDLVQIAQHADDLERATAFYADLLGAAPTATHDPPGAHVETEPHAIFSHDDATPGPAGTDEWQAFVRDPEGNLVGLVEHRVR